MSGGTAEGSTAHHRFLQEQLLSSALGRLARALPGTLRDALWVQRGGDEAKVGEDVLPLSLLGAAEGQA